MLNWSAQLLLVAMFSSFCWFGLKHLWSCSLTLDLSWFHFRHWSREHCLLQRWYPLFCHDCQKTKLAGQRGHITCKCAHCNLSYILMRRPLTCLKRLGDHNISFHCPIILQNRLWWTIIHLSVLLKEIYLAATTVDSPMSQEGLFGQYLFVLRQPMWNQLSLVIICF